MANNRRTPLLIYALLITLVLICLNVLYVRSGSEGPQELPRSNKNPHRKRPHLLRNISDEEAYAAIKDIIPLINSGGLKSCKYKSYGSSWGAHELCEVPFSEDCKFISFGISTEYSFDLDLSRSAKCRGLAFDPTVNLSSKLGGNVWFLAMGATSVLPPSAAWIITSVPAVLQWMNWDHIDVLKMDCEGCEYALAQDILREDLDFFDKIDQVAYEFHVSRAWVRTEETVINMGKLFLLMKEAGLELMTAVINPCDVLDEAPGCHPKLEELGYPCGRKKMCQNFLFAKPKQFPKKKPILEIWD